MSFFNRQKGQTGIGAVVAAFDARFASCPQTEQVAALGLMRAILAATSKAGMPTLGPELLPFVVRLLPYAASGDLGPRLVCAIEDSAPALRAEVMRAMGAEYWYARVESARSALS